MHYRNGYYYLFWNEGSCCAGTASTYTIWVARSQGSITGPYSGNRIFYAGGGNIHGPGHIGIYSACGVERFTYHYYPTATSILGENELTWSSDNWPVVGAVSTTPLKPCGNTGQGGQSGQGGNNGNGGNAGKQRRLGRRHRRARRRRWHDVRRRGRTWKRRRCGWPKPAPARPAEKRRGWQTGNRGRQWIRCGRFGAGGGSPGYRRRAGRRAKPAKMRYQAAGSAPAVNGGTPVAGTGGTPV